MGFDLQARSEISLTALIDMFFEQWIQTRQVEAEAIRTKDFSQVRDNAVFNGIHEGGNSVNRAGYRHLRTAAERLLHREKLDGRVRVETAYRSLVRAFFDCLPKIRATGTFSAHAVVARATRMLRDLRRDDGIYVFPIVFAPQAKSSDFHIGPIRIVAKEVFLKEHETAFAREGEADQLRSQLANDWREYIGGYDHFVTVEMRGFEAEAAWTLARETAEFALNLIRMLFGHYHTDDIRIGNGFRWEIKQSSVRIEPDGSAFFSSSRGPWGTHLDDRWAEHFHDNLGYYSQLLASYAYWLSQGIDVRNPVYERMRYANRLIAEGYAEPHDHIRLVRVVSALEALSLVHGADKAHNLALHCAYAGAWGDPERACSIYDAVRGAYTLRSAVVHGDAPLGTHVRSAFAKLEGHLLEVYLGFTCLLANVQKSSPQSVSVLRREVNRRIAWFYWYREPAA